MGGTDLLVYPGPGGTEAALRKLLPAGSRIDPMFATSETLAVPAWRCSVTVRSYDGRASVADGHLLGSGCYPATTGRSLISASVDKFASVDIGGTIDLRELGTAKIVGIIEEPLSLTTRIVLADPSLATRAMASNAADWLVALPAGLDVQSIDLPLGMADRRRLERALLCDDALGPAPGSERPRRSDARPWWPRPPRCRPRARRHSPSAPAAASARSACSPPQERRRDSSRAASWLRLFRRGTASLLGAGLGILGALLALAVP